MKEISEMSDEECMRELRIEHGRSADILPWGADGFRCFIWKVEEEKTFNAATRSGAYQMALAWMRARKSGPDKEVFKKPNFIIQDDALPPDILSAIKEHDAAIEDIVNKMIDFMHTGQPGDAFLLRGAWGGDKKYTIVETPEGRNLVGEDNTEEAEK